MNRIFVAFVLITSAFLGINQYLGVVEEQSRLPFYCVFGVYAFFLSWYVFLFSSKSKISVFAKISIFLTLLSAGKCFFSGAPFHYYFFLYAILFSLVIVFSERIVISPGRGLPKITLGVEFILWCVFIVTLFKSFSSGESVRYGLEINPVAPLAIPWILLLFGWRKVALFALALGIAIFSGKRSQILAFGTLPIAFFLTLRANEFGKKVKTIFVGVCAFILATVLFIVANNFSEIGSLSDRFSSESLSSGSGRMESFDAAILAIMNMDFPEFIYGLSNHSMYLAQQNGFLGHCDFLTIFLNYGIFALCAYLLFHFFLWYRSWCLYRNKSPFAFSYLCMTLISLIMALVSFLFVPNPATVIFCLWIGVFEGLIRDNKTNFNFSVRDRRF